MSETKRAPHRLAGAGAGAGAGVAGVLAAAVLLAVVGCGAVPLKPTPTERHAASRTPAPTPTVAPTFDLAGDAQTNRKFFDQVSLGVLAVNPEAGGADFINALIARGFDKSHMEVTPDRTVVDLVADSIQFSVRINDECLIGQNGAATQGYHSMVAPTLATGMCLVGTTRQIDW